MPPSSAVASKSKVAADKALAALAPHGGELLQTSLWREIDDEIQGALGGAEVSVAATR